MVSGQQVIAMVGGDLKIESLQDKSTFDAKQESGGFSLSLCIPPFCYGTSTASGNVSSAKVSGDYASVVEQSGIKAGDGGFQVEVKGNTDLKGATLASTDRAVQDGINRLSTRTLTTSDMANRDTFKANGYALSGSMSVSGPAKPTAEGTSADSARSASGNSKTTIVTPGGSAGVGSKDGTQTSTTFSRISGGVIEIRDDSTQKVLTGNDAATTIASLRRDANSDASNSSALSKVWDGQQLLKEVQLQAKITQTFSQQAPKAIADFSDGQAKSLKDSGNAEDAKKWEEGGIYRAALHAVGGALAGGTDGALGAGAVAGAAPLITDLQDRTVNALVIAGMSETAANVLAKGLGQMTAAGVGATIGGAQGAALGYSVDTNNRQLHHKEISSLRAAAKAIAAKDGADHELTPEQLQQFENYWFDQLTAAARAAVDPIAAKNQQQFIDQVAATNKSGYDGLQGAGKYLRDVQIAQEIIGDMAGATILGTDGKPIIADGGELRAFQATSAQYYDSQLFLTNDPKILTREFGSIGAAKVAGASESRWGNISSVSGSDKRSRELLSEFRKPSEGVESVAPEAYLVGTGAVARKLVTTAVDAGKGILESVGSNMGQKTIVVTPGEHSFAFNAIENPGPLASLPGSPATNFFAGRYNKTVLTDDLVLYRGGEAGKPLGQWFTREAPQSVTEIRIDSAVKQQWIDARTGILTGNSTIDTLYAIRIPKGTTLYEGPVGYQGGIYLGGPSTNQIFVPTPWNIKGVQVINATPIR